MTNDQFTRRSFLAGSLAAAAGASMRRVLAQGAGPSRLTGDVVPIEGETYQAALAAVEPSGQLRFLSAAGERVLAAADLVAWGAPVEPAAVAQIHLTDGGLVVAAQLLESDPRCLKFDSDEFGEVNLPLKLISGILLHPPANRDERDRLAFRLAKSRAESSSTNPERKKDARAHFTDQILLVNGDELAGKLIRLKATSIEFETAVGPIAPDSDKVAAVLLGRTRESPPRDQGLRILTGFRDGSLLVAESLLVDQRQARLELGGVFTLAAAAEQVVSLQPLGGRAVYLSDLKAESYLHVPFLSLGWPYRADACVTGSRLRAGGRAYLKGIGMHSASRLTYRLEGHSFTRFAAELAIDDRTEGRGSVAFRAFVDDREAYKSPVIRARMPVLPISVDIAGGKRLSLVVDFAERGDELDHADWLDARLVQ